MFLICQSIQHLVKMTSLMRLANSPMGFQYTSHVTIRIDFIFQTKITFSETSMEGSGDKKDTVDSNGTLIKDNISTEESKGAVKFEDTGSDAEVD